MPLRPTPDAMRERVFAVLSDRVSDARFLDLFAGTGSVGLEALSRLVRANCENLDLEGSRARLIVRPALEAVLELAAKGDAFDLAWADPPFESWQDGLEALASAFRSGLLSRPSLACLECPTKANVEGSLPPGLELVRDLAGGASRVVMIARS